MVKVFKGKGEFFQEVCKLLQNWNSKTPLSKAGEHIHLKLNSIKESILDFRNRLIANGYPKNTHQQIEGRFRATLLQNNVQEHQIGNAAQLRQKIRDDMQSADEFSLQNCFEQLSSVFHLPNTTEWRNRMHQFLLKNAGIEKLLLETCEDIWKQSELTKAKKILQSLNEVNL